MPGIRDMRDKLKSLNSEALVITDQSNQQAASQGRAPGPTFAVEELYGPIPYIIPAQLFAANFAAEKGITPDQPRTLQKVTRTL